MVAPGNRRILRWIFAGGLVAMVADVARPLISVIQADRASERREERLRQTHTKSSA